MLSALRPLRTNLIPRSSCSKPRMASTEASIPHFERTAQEPRDDALHSVKISKIEQVNSKIRLYQLTPSSPIKFWPGQWLDVYCPSLPKAGGFTITSSPTTTSYVELAIQKSSNPPAKWLWQDPLVILGKELKVRVGGSFVWLRKKREGIKRVVFVAGGVGINPLMSMLSYLAELKRINHRIPDFEIKFLYSTKKENGQKVLFLARLLHVFDMLGSQGELRLFTTGPSNITGSPGRIQEKDLLDALGKVEDRGSTVCYICGVPKMTDEFVELVKKAEGMKEENVLFEKWW